jgi:hypothetical protein
MYTLAYELKTGAPNLWCSTFYMSSCFWLLGVESRDFSQPEKEITACKPEQIHKMTLKKNPTFAV